MVEDLWVRWRTINWTVRESEIFLSLCVSILHVISIDESSSLWNISPKQIFRVLKNSFWHSRGILVVSCETLWWAALLVDGPRAFLVKQWSGGGGGAEHVIFWTISNVFPGVLQRISTILQLSTDRNERSIGGFWLVSLLTFYLLFLLIYRFSQD